MRRDFYASMPKWKYPFYIMRHPVDGYHELKNNNKFSVKFANFILFAWFVLAIFNWGYIDFDFRNNFSEVSLFNIFLSSVALFISVVVSNWCFTTLMDGKGRMPEIWTCCSYALLPYVLCGYIRLALSFILVFDEAVFLTYLMMIAVGWSAFLFVLGLSILHEYSLSKTIGSIALTILGVLIIIFLAILISGLAVQMYGFVMTIYSEIAFRMV